MLAEGGRCGDDAVNGREHGAAPADRRVTVLIVDDDARVRRALRDLLEATPDLAVVAVAGSARDALADDAEHAPDVVILDVLLPQAADGLHVLRALRSRNRAVVAMSVLGSLRQRAITDGAFAFLEKEGRDIDRLHDVVRAAQRSIDGGRHGDRR